MDSKEEMTLSQKIVTDAVLKMDDYKKMKWLTRRYGKGKALDKAFDKVFSSLEKTNIYGINQRIELLQDLNASHDRISNEIEDLIENVTQDKIHFPPGHIIETINTIKNNQLKFELIEFCSSYDEFFNELEKHSYIFGEAFDRCVIRTLEESNDLKSILSLLSLRTTDYEIIKAIGNKLSSIELTPEVIQTIANMPKIEIEEKQLSILHNELLRDNKMSKATLILFNVIKEEQKMELLNNNLFIIPNIETELEKSNAKEKEALKSLYKTLTPFLLPKNAPEKLAYKYYGNRYNAGTLDFTTVIEYKDFLKDVDLRPALFWHKTLDNFKNQDEMFEYFDMLKTWRDSNNPSYYSGLGFYSSNDFNLKEAISNKCCESIKKYSYTPLIKEKCPQSFVKEHKELFLPEDIPSDLKQMIHDGIRVSYIIVNHPEWVKYFKNIDLNLVGKFFDNSNELIDSNSVLTEFNSREDALLCLSYFTEISSYATKVISQNNIKQRMFDTIYSQIINESNPIGKYQSGYAFALPEEFKKKYSELFLPENAPDELKNKVYHYKLEPKDIVEHPEWIHYLSKINLNIIIPNYDKTETHTSEVDSFKNQEETIKYIAMLNYIRGNKDRFYYYSSINVKNEFIKSIKNTMTNYEYYPTIFTPNIFFDSSVIDAIKENNLDRSFGYFRFRCQDMSYLKPEEVAKYFESREDAIKCCIMYKYIIQYIQYNKFNSNLNTDNIKESLFSVIHKAICVGILPYNEDMPEDFKKEFPDLFLSADAPEELKQLIYNRNLEGKNLLDHPEWIDVLTKENINLNVLFNLKDVNYEHIDVNILAERFDSREDAIKTFAMYKVFCKNNNGNDIDIENPKESIHQIVHESILTGSRYFEHMPEDFKKEFPDLFLSADAPEELKNYFYDSNAGWFMSFKKIQEHKDWLPFITGKRLTASLLRNPTHNKKMMKYFEVFGEEKAIKLGISRAETIEQMVFSNQADLMKAWYDKTGQKFIPDFVIMQNFKIEEADKFLTSGKIWSNLMKIKSFTQTPEAREAMLKLAYSFGAFDQDQRGIKKLQDLLVGLPKKIDLEQAHIFEQIATQIDYNGQTDLIESLRQENVDIDFSKNIFEQIYRKNEDGSYTLAINAQSCPKSAQAIRGVLEKFREVPMLTPDKAHHYLGGFKLEYDSDFRELFLSNFDIIIGDSKYLSQISAIQRRFKEIKTKYSNVNLTLDLAMSYINNNKYENVNTGNERVTQVAGLQNYSQQDFETLQQIYNYGKQRTFSSIPRISSDKSVNLPSGTYHYEFLRLDVPRAMSIGFESDCCQRLGEPAEVCMEHSMVDKNGRVFIITNTAGEIVAQSWVWRNKDVLCFDNIEVPDQKMWDNGIPRGQEDSGIRNQFTDDILAIYKMVAHELIEVDEKVYKELLDSSKITQEQYEGLRLGKITAGLGYSNIKGSLKTLPIDKAILSRPLPFEEPVKLSRGLYTSDSTRQYVLEEREDRKEFDGETLPVHSDTYVEYSDSNFTEKSLLSLEKLEIVTKEDPRNLETSVSDYADSEHLVTEIARNYGLNPETTKIVMNPNFAIIYDANDNKLEIGDLLFNTKIDNGEQQMDIENQVVMQIRLALEQIANNKEVDISNLDEKQKEMYDKVTGLTEEIDVERGVGHAR